MTAAPGDARFIQIDRPAAEVFGFIADPAKLDLWSFGTWTVLRRDGDTIDGAAIFDGGRITVRVDPCPQRLLVDYWIGSERAALQPRIFARVTPGELAGRGAGCSLLTLAALRAAGMDDERWQRLTASHRFELLLIKRLVETGYDHRRAAPGPR